MKPRLAADKQEQEQECNAFSSKNKQKKKICVSLASGHWVYVSIVLVVAGFFDIAVRVVVAVRHRVADVDADDVRPAAESRAGPTPRGAVSLERADVQGPARHL